MGRDIPPKFLAHVYINSGPMPISPIILFFQWFLNRLNIWLWFSRLYYYNNHLIHKKTYSAIFKDKYTLFMLMTENLIHYICV